MISSVISFPVIKNILSDTRYRRAAGSTIAAGASSAASVGLTLITLPLLLHHLGPARFGVWMTLYSFISVLSFMDLGVGLGLMNGIAECSGRDDRQAARRLVSSALAILTGVAVLAVLAVAIVSPLLPWQAILNIPRALAPEATAAAAALLMCIALLFPANIGSRIQAGYQQGYLNSLSDVVARIISAGAIVALVLSGGGLLATVLAVVGVLVLVGAGNTFIAIYWRFPWLIPSAALVSSEAAYQMLRRGGMFLTLQLVTAVIVASDNIIVAHFGGPAAVSQYAVPKTLFQFITTGLNLTLFPLWPAYAEAISRGDLRWVRRTIRGSLLLTFALSTAATGFLALFSGFILRLWVGGTIHVSPALLAGLAVSTVLAVFGNALHMLLNAASLIRFQIAMGVATGVITLVGKIYLGAKFGATGIVWATALGYMLVSFIPECLYVRHWLVSRERDLVRRSVDEAQCLQAS